ncbi:MAG: rubrerythrin [bacterium]|nr:rubrerythrin [bacterium]
MNRTRKPHVVGLLALLLAVALAAPAPAQAPTTQAKTAEGKTTTTLDNLKTAFNGESNAHARYLAFAKKADEDGYLQVGSLFRAAARAEAIHAANHATVIKKMGGMPEARIDKPEVKTTRENLMAAIKGETYEKDTMYPAFLKQAKAEADRDAERTFAFAGSVEAGHAKLYKSALDRLESTRGGPMEFRVCTICGNTVPIKQFTFEKCPICFNSKDKYVKVI